VVDSKLLGNSALNNEIGIEPIVREIVISLLSLLMKEVLSPDLQHKAIKALEVLVKVEQL
jgi:hypothetical protein